MNAGEIFVLILAILISAAGLTALLMVLAALLPRVTARSKMALVESARRAFFIGLANYVFIGGIALLLANIGDVLAVVALILLAFLTVVTALGLAGLALHTGERLAELRRVELSPFRQLLWGAGAIELATLAVPFAGWFLLAPAALMVSFGAAVLAWRNRKMEI